MANQTQDDLRRAAARVAAKVATTEHRHSVLGLGTGRTVGFFLEEICRLDHNWTTCIASSNDTRRLAGQMGLTCLEVVPRDVDIVYIDSADEVEATTGAMIKGGRGALTKEKIIAAAARCFICVADQSKVVHALGDYALPVEVIPLAVESVEVELAKRGFTATGSRETSENENVIIRVTARTLVLSKEIEQEINNIEGVVASGLFARRPCDVLIVAPSVGPVWTLDLTSGRRSETSGL